MSIENEIYQIIGQRLLDEFDSKQLVDWAVNKLEAKYDAESLWILAGLDSGSREEREDYFWKSLQELNIDINEENADISYGKFIARSVLKNQMPSYIGLKEMVKIYHSNKSRKKNKFFHFNEIALEVSCMENIGLPLGVEPKIPYEDMESFLRKEFESFLEHEKLGIERKVLKNEYHHNWDKLLGAETRKQTNGLTSPNNLINKLIKFVQSVVSRRK